MTHFIGAVAVTQELLAKHGTQDGAVGEAVAKFDENTVVPRYVEHTKEELIAQTRADYEEYKSSGPYARYHEDPEAYKLKYDYNPDHLEYLEKEFPKKLEWTDEEVYADATKWHEEDQIGPEGEVYSTYNPDSKWDWWVIGGRWEEEYATRQGEDVSKLITAAEEALAKVTAGESMRPPMEGSPFEDKDRLLPWWFPYSVVIPSEDTYEWVSQGNMLYFGLRNDTLSEEQWIKESLATLKALPEGTKIYYVDFHI